PPSILTRGAFLLGSPSTLPLTGQAGQNDCGITCIPYSHTLPSLPTSYSAGFLFSLASAMIC
ncbi:MAG: hypothetical protein MK035_08305, partial [Dehalococcoidia bacterium]|nr:hypothetical protein [Dehalococcoidia bacterium]